MFPLVFPTPPIPHIPMKKENVTPETQKHMQGQHAVHANKQSNKASSKLSILHHSELRTHREASKE